VVLDSSKMLKPMMRSESVSDSMEGPVGVAATDNHCEPCESHIAAEELCACY